MQTPRLRSLRLFAIIILLIGMVGCATTEQRTGPLNPEDPWEDTNRNIYAFNDALDRNVFIPVAEAYAFVVPQPVRTCINNIFLNLGEVWSFINSNLQGRHEDAINTFGRFMLNTTMGLGGCFDLASSNGAPRISNDFGTTLGVWGVEPGPFVVLPIIGASTVRDTGGRVVDLYVNQVGWGQLVTNSDLRNSMYGLEFIDRRESLLDVTKTIDKTAIDRYSFIRDAYLQHRKALVRGTRGAQELPSYEDFQDAPADEKSLGIQKAK